METNDKDYIDAKLQAVIERLNGDARAHQIATDARFVQVNQVMEAGFESQRKDNEIYWAQMEAYLQKMVSEVTKSQSEVTRSQGEIIKWVAAICTASAAITISATTLLVAQSAPRTPAPIVIYAPPTPALVKPHTSAASSPQPFLTAHAAQTWSASSQSIAQSARLAATPAVARLMRTMR